MIEWQWAMGIFLGLVGAAAGFILKFSNELTKLTGEMEQIKERLTTNEQTHEREKVVASQAFKELYHKVDDTANQNAQILGKLNIIEQILLKK